MDTASIRDLVCKEVIQRFGDSVNSRGIIVLPIPPWNGKGVVQFNVMNSKDPHYGLNRLSFSVGSDGTVEFTLPQNTL